MLRHSRNLQSHSWQVNRTLWLGAGVVFFLFSDCTHFLLFIYFSFETAKGSPRDRCRECCKTLFELQSRGFSAKSSPESGRSGRFKSLPPSSAPPPVRMMGSYGVNGEQETRGQWGTDPAPTEEPETQPGAGRTRMDLLWPQRSSEQWLMPGFVNVGQCSHTPTEMALFSKIQPAPTVFLGVQQSRVDRRINPGVIAAGLYLYTAGCPQAPSCPPQHHAKTARGGEFSLDRTTLWGKKILVLVENALVSTLGTQHR